MRVTHRLFVRLVPGLWGKGLSGAIKQTLAKFPKNISQGGRLEKLRLLTFLEPVIDTFTS